MRWFTARKNSHADAAKKRGMEVKMRKYRKTIAMMLMATLSAALMSGCAGSGDQAASVQSSSADGGTQEQTDTAGTVSEASSIETAETGDSGAGKIAYSGGKQTITYWHTHSDAGEGSSDGSDHSGV